MDTFTLGLPRWPILRAFSPNPLVRFSDRVESAVALLAVAVTLLAIAVAGAAATAVHDSHRTGDATPTSESARPSAEVTDHTRNVEAAQIVGYGDGVDIQTTGDPDQADRPTSATAADVDAALTGLALWLSVAVAAATAVAATRVILDRVRDAAWQHAIDTLVGNGEGRDTRHH